MPKQAKRLALKAALSAKLADGEIIFIDDISIAKPRTKDMTSIIRNLGLDGKSLLVVIPENNDAVKLSARNIPGVHVSRAADLNAYNVLSHNRVLIAKGAVAILEEAETA